MKTKFMLLATLFMLGCSTDSEEGGGKFSTATRLC